MIYDILAIIPTILNIIVLKLEENKVGEEDVFLKNEYSFITIINLLTFCKAVVVFYYEK